MRPYFMGWRATEQPGNRTLKKTSHFVLFCTPLQRFTAEGSEIQFPGLKSGVYAGALASSKNGRALSGPSLVQ